jgi:beta-lactamase regulating signal transducer with metallopeptidase domain
MLSGLLLHLATVAVLALLALALGRWRRLGPAARHALWLVVLLKLLTPPLLFWPWPLPLPTADTPVFRHDSPDRAVVERVPALVVDLPPPLLDAPVEPPLEVAAPRTAAASKSVQSWLTAEAGWELLGGLWLLGGGIVAATHVRRIFRLRRALALSAEPPSALVERIRELVAEMRIRPPRVRTLPGLASPMVWGLGAPRLLWPRGLEERLTAEGLKAVLIHELAHLKRRDHWVGWLLLAGACAWWWLPLFGLVRRRLSQEAELACDAWVVAALPQARRVYAEALLEVCQRISQAAPAAPAWGAAGGRRDLERRLVMILQSRAPNRLTPGVLAGVGLLALLALPAWTLGENDPKKTAEPVSARHDIDEITNIEIGLDDVQAVKTATDADREKKIAALEAKVAELLKELKSLRDAKGDQKKELERWYRMHLEMAANEYKAKPAAPAEIALVRSNYKLPVGKAAAIAKFLADNVKAPVLETKVDGDSLVVTTTPEYQHAVAQLVGLVQGKLPTSRPSGLYGPAGMPPMTFTPPKPVEPSNRSLSTTDFPPPLTLTPPNAVEPWTAPVVPKPSPRDPPANTDNKPKPLPRIEPSKP